MYLVAFFLCVHTCSVARYLCVAVVNFRLRCKVSRSGQMTEVQKTYTKSHTVK